MGVMLDIASLSIEERLELIDRLWESIEQKDGEDEHVPDLSPAQLAELERRLANYDESELIDGEEFHRQLRQRIG
jgi:putative addiction module component (TIGR02574 family)